MWWQGKETVVANMLVIIANSALAVGREFMVRQAGRPIGLPRAEAGMEPSDAFFRMVYARAGVFLV